MRVALLAVLIMVSGLAWRADAQPPPDTAPNDRQSGPPVERVAPAPLYLQADQLIYDAGGGRFIGRGNVELHFNNYVVTADEVVYDKAGRKLVATGQAMLKDPQGDITRADRLELSPDFVASFEATLGTSPADVIAPPQR